MSCRFRYHSVLLILILIASSLYGQGADGGWWSLRQLIPPPVPPLDGVPEQAVNPVDAFVLAQLREAGLPPSPSADRRTLIRRATVDLHGLLPTPEETEAFVKDTRPDAFERLVDRLLASPRYGERWARHWLDVAHYADTHGYDKDKVRPNAWPYRDWVIKALNDDVPWARFVQMQIAGDIIAPHDPDGAVAVGFIAAGPWDFVGHVELREGTVDKKITRYLDRDDMVASTMSSFASLTVHCARCHDHKFDPISQGAYYGLQAVFAGVERSDRDWDPPEVAGRRRELKAARDDLLRESAALAPRVVETPEVMRVRASRDAAKKVLDGLPPLGATSPSNGWHSAIMDGPDHEKWVEVDLGSPSVVDEIILWPARPVDFRDTPGFGFPSAYSVTVAQAPDGSGARTLIRRDEGEAANPGDGPVRIPGDGKPVRVIRVTAHRLWKRYDDWVMALSELQAVAGGRDVARGKAVRAKDSIEAGLWSARYLVDGYTSRHAIGAGSEAERIRREAESGLARRERDLQVVILRVERERHPEHVAQRENVEGRLAKVDRELAALPPPRRVYAATSTFTPQGAFTPSPGNRPRPVHVLERGDVTRPGRKAGPRSLDCVEGVSAELDGDHASEGERRAALARWLVREENPLLWRSIVNRAWHHHFGHGLVTTPNDFGRMGGKPSHPELLEWLAAWLRGSGGSLKALHRLILTSATWRQVSTHDPVRAARDGQNRLLWRANRRRLDGESVRDAVLSVAGTLDLTMGGPGYRAFGFKDDHSPHYRYDQYDPEDRSTWRRAIYRFQVRSVPDPFMETMDCPDPSRSVPVRSQTVTGLQALALLNNRFMLVQAGAFARRVESDAKTLDAQVTRVMRLALGRSPDPAEAERLVGYARRHGLPALCRLVFNLNEFLFVD